MVVQVTRPRYSKCFAIYDSEAGTLTLQPINSAGNTELKDFFDGEGANTSVAIVQSDAGRSGNAETSGPYSKVVLTLTA